MKVTQDRTPLLALVVVTWNAKKYVDLCLRSLDQVEAMPLEIIVVDNASTDGTPELIASEFKRFKLIRNIDNLGFAKANNIGIRSSSGQYICLVNSDVTVPIGCLSNLVNYLESNPGVGMVGPQMLGPDGNVRRSTMRFPSLLSSIGRALALDRFPLVSRLVGSQLVADFAHDRTADVDILNGWFWVVRREALNQVGLLDEQFFMYGEDMDWCLRFRKAGWGVVFYPDANAIHFGGGSSSAAPVRFHIEKYRADFQYWRKHHGVIALAVYAGIVFLNNLLRMIGYLAINLVRPKRKAESAAKVRRSWALLKWMVGLQGKQVTGQTPSAPLSSTA